MDKKVFVHLLSVQGGLQRRSPTERRPPGHRHQCVGGHEDALGTRLGTSGTERSPGLESAGKTSKREFGGKYHSGGGTASTGSRDS